MRILGIDPGTAIVGWGVIDIQGSTIKTIAFGHIETSKNLPMSKRLFEISTNLQSIIKKYQPSESAVEELFFFKNQKTIISVAQARGCILLTLENLCVNMYGYTPLEIKQALTNYGRADKAQVQLMVKTILKLATIPKPDDTADALAVALCHASRRKMENIKQSGVSL
ncbi:MAG: crossover junction endodeoxyribonuclease RuvC [Candidatus Moranbacteria bacterium]|nr:crossover junction endodeoxyribonuclease RuvC [Candidatus Moranbacteria bacterium]OIQ02562.1 MAG: crossover junction endodeoxyribonuclease RuvC [Candidatus Moranbacteria bacterium CG2_30_41_165]PIP25987.1 MAG: crossover junction endodeoxyribonuclease RuvC [Candidatus Moranbacteria bacterium CG23_combo_of_CG06-09_8_20_14_all_41_28]PIV86660.1 MAG: crossover junction endodeoxyribonuclease RuvC [Candidatus Moranbacteria bacterium CG17_big_fil_post_rev_8_21_14_2_50_41_107]PIW94238.1 MAG: crossove